MPLNRVASKFNAFEADFLIAYIDQSFVRTTNDATGNQGFDDNMIAPVNDLDVISHEDVEAIGEVAW